MFLPARRAGRRRLLSLIGSILILSGLLPVAPVAASNAVQVLPFTQDWSNTAQITVNDDWSGVPGIEGFRGDGLTATTGVDPQTVVGEGTPILDVNIGQATTFATGGVAEFDALVDPVVALQGSGTARAPHLVINLDTTGASVVNVAYKLRDVDLNDNAVQPVALQYRVGTTGNYTNVPAGFVADATTGGSATQVTPVSVNLPAEAANQPLVQVRVITTDAVGSDEWVGIDDISITSADAAPFVGFSSPVNGATGVPTSTIPSFRFSEPVVLSGVDPVSLTCLAQGTKAGSLGTSDNTSYTLTVLPFLSGDTCTLTIKGAQTSDVDANDPPDLMAADHVITFAIAGALPQLLINEIDYDQPFLDTTEFLEIRNNGAAPVNLDPVIVTFFNAATSSSYRDLDLPSFTLAAGGHYVVCANAALVANCNLDGTPDTDFIQNGAPDALALRIGAAVLDTVSYEGVTPGFTEGSGGAPTDTGAAAPAPPQSISRCPDGDDTNDNAADFELRTSSPGAANLCADRLTLSINDVSAAEGDGGTTNFTFTVSLSAPAGPAGVTFDITTADDTATTADNDYIANNLTGQFIGDAGSTYAFTVVVNGDTSVEGNETFFVTVTNVAGAALGDGQGQGTIVNDDVTLTPIHTIQGATHTSPLLGSSVSTTGVVTAELSNGFYIQDPLPDADGATSEAIFVFTDAAPTVNVGDDVLVTGTVSEFRPGGATSANLTKTEIDFPVVAVQSTGNPLPATAVIGIGGRVPPTTVIDDDATGSVETSGTFDANTDGIDFYESLESMRVQVNDPVTVGPRNGFGEIWVLADDGAGAAARTNRGGIVVRPTDFNPEKIQLDDGLGVATPAVNVGDHFTGPAVGIVDYNFGNFEINLTAAMTAVSDGVARETTSPPGLNQLAVATFNVENLDANEPPSKFDALADQIVNRLLSPDVIALEEIQDNNGPTNDAVVDADQTLGKLIAAIAAAGGPTYQFRQINPVDDADGGEPGGNIRVGFLFRTDRGVAFVDRPGGGSTTPTTILDNGGVPELSSSPGRVDPTNTAWTTSRKPLAGEFTYRGQTFFLIANHFNSKGGDNPLFGRFQPPVRGTEVQRHQQAQVVHDFVDSVLAVDPDANVIVLGDINDFEFSETVQILTAGGILHDLMETLPGDQRYSYVFEGNSQVLDHIIVSTNLLPATDLFDPVHVNAEFHDQLSDHDPSVALFSVNDAPTVDAGGPYTVVEGSSVTVSATGSDPNGDTLSYAWDLDNNGTFETLGQTATFNAPAGSAPTAFTIRARATDTGGLFATDIATVQVIWPFTGFLAPLLNPPAENTSNAGAGVPVKFMLGGDQGLGVIAAGYPRSIEYTCGTPVGSRPTDATAPTQSTGFTFSPTTGIYTYSWKTQKSWQDTCRRFVLKLTDETFHYVDIHFVK